MSFRSEKFGKYILRPAEPSDSPAIREIFGSGSFSGELNVQFLRGEDPLVSFEADGERAHILVADDTEAGRTVAVGGAVVRTEFLNGERAKCAYLTGLKVHADYRGRLSFIPRAYRIMGELVSDCAFTYTTILDSNTAVIRMLEKRRRNMPEYRFLGHYTTFCIGGGKPVVPVERGNTDGFDELMERHFSAKSLTPCDSGLAGFGKKEFYAVRGENGEIQACCFIGDQSATKYYRMCSYGGIYRLVSRFPTRLLGYPPFPEPGSVIRDGIVSYLYVRGNDKALSRRFLLSAAHESGFPMLLWGGFENDPLCEAVGRMRTVRYGSRLYEAVWNEPHSIDGVIGVEAGLL
ncbi:MAG: hypothetical protein IK093_16165 [Ruminiclostridium sp.]|nr:hypothetical protein [Ruminiclostridium sp.]